MCMHIPEGGAAEKGAMGVCFECACIYLGVVWRKRQGDTHQAAEKVSCVVLARDPLASLPAAADRSALDGCCPKTVAGKCCEKMEYVILIT